MLCQEHLKLQKGAWDKNRNSGKWAENYKIKLQFSWRQRGDRLTSYSPSLLEGLSTVAWVVYFISTYFLCFTGTFRYYKGYHEEAQANARNSEKFLYYHAKLSQQKISEIESQKKTLSLATDAIQRHKNFVNASKHALASSSYPYAKQHNIARRIGPQHLLAGSHRATHGSESSDEVDRTSPNFPSFAPSNRG